MRWRRERGKGGRSRGRNGGREDRGEVLHALTPYKMIIHTSVQRAVVFKLSKDREQVY